MAPVSSKPTLLAPGNSWAGTANQDHVKSSSSAQHSPCPGLGAGSCLLPKPGCCSPPCPAQAGKRLQAALLRPAQEITESRNLRIVWNSRDMEDHLVPASCHRQGHLPRDQVATVLRTDGSRQESGCLSFCKAAIPSRHHLFFHWGSLTDHCSQGTGGDAAVPDALCTMRNFPAPN